MSSSSGSIPDMTSLDGDMEKEAAPPAKQPTPPPPPRSLSGQRVDELRPDEVRWFHATADDQPWSAFRGADSLRIERRWRRQNGQSECEVDEAAAAGGDDGVIVLDGLYRLNLHCQMIEPIYWSGGNRVLKRGTWFFKDTWQPLPAPLAAVAEQEHLRVFRGQVIPVKPVFFDKDSKKKPVLSQVDVEADLLQLVWHSVIDIDLRNTGAKSRLLRYVRIGGAERPLMRSFHSLALPDDEAPRADHLVFVIHGVGHKNQTRRIVESTDTMRGQAEALLRASLPDCHSRPFFLPVEWRSKVQLDGRTVESITLPHVRGVRSALNATAMDIMYYTSTLYGPEIVSGVIRVLNDLYERFLTLNPDFLPAGGKVSIFAHSLGSVICYDILTGRANDAEGAMLQGLQFKVENLFCFGSPLAVFLALRKQRPEGVTEPSANFGRLFNVFHPTDPVAYRIEPLLDAQYARLRPARIGRASGAASAPPYDEMAPKLYPPSHHVFPSEDPTRNDGDFCELEQSVASLDGSGRSSDAADDRAAIEIADEASFDSSPSPSKPAKSTWASVFRSRPTAAKGTKAANEKPSETRRRASAEEFLLQIEPSNRLWKRVDFELKEGRTEISYWSVFKSHFVYWTNPDAVMFVLSQLYHQPKG